MAKMKKKIDRENFCLRVKTRIDPSQFFDNPIQFAKKIKSKLVSNVFILGTN